MNPKECKLLQEQVVVLGLVVSWEGISTHSEKVRVIKELPVPVDESQLRTFPGTAGYCRELCQTMPTLRPLCTVHAKKGTFLDRQLNVRKPSWKLSANCRMPPSLLSPRCGYCSGWTVMPVTVGARGVVVSGSKWEGTCNSIRCACTIKG